jgi:uncharacterized protein YndB with AHSA1/START domain
VPDVSFAYGMLGAMAPKSMTRWYPLEPCDETFFQTAPHIYRFEVDLPVPPARVWESLTSDNSFADWGPLAKSVQWTSPRPFGVGTSRTVVLAGAAMTVHEQYFRWDEGQRHSFYVREANRPLLRRMAEDYVIEERPAGSRLTWTFALEGTARTSLLVKALSPGNRLLFGRMANSAKGYFAKNP